MPDATYDAIVIGGGSSGLTLANYLLKYGGMDVAIFEARPELGGGWGCEEAAPGFIANTHASYLSRYYTQPLEWDFPLREKGFRYIPYQVASGAIFAEDQSCLCLYSREIDPVGERTAHQVARFSSRDAETLLWLIELYNQHVEPVLFKYMFNPPPALEEQNPLERLWIELCKLWPDRIEPGFMARSEIQVLRDLFESEAVVAGLSRLLHSAMGTSPDIQCNGVGSLFRILLILLESGTWRGGTHSLAHVLSRTFVEEGGQFLTKAEVDRVIVENGRAQGVVLTDGQQFRARQLVTATVDPATLCFRFMGKDHLTPRLARRVAHLERWRICITWYGWAVHELPAYRAAAVEPDINKAGRLALINKDPEAMGRNHAWRKLGKMCPEMSLSVWAHSNLDPTQAPQGKHVLGSEEFVLPANWLTDQEWKEFKKRHAEDTIREWEKYAPNMTWDNVIGYFPLTPIDCINCANYGPEGNWAVIDMIPSQMGSFRPVPELAHYRTPVNGLYATGAAWHRAGAGSCSAGYNCYKVIAKELGLKKPWEEQNRPF